MTDPRPSLRDSGPDPADRLAAFLAAAEYAILQAPQGSDEDASEALISAGCWYAPRLLAAVEAVLALTRDNDGKDFPGWWEVTVGEFQEAIRGALLGEGER